MPAESIHVESKLDWRLVEGREGECHRARSDDLTHQSFAVRGEQGIVIDGVIPLLDEDFTVIEAQLDCVLSRASFGSRGRMRHHVDLARSACASDSEMWPHARVRNDDVFVRCQLESDDVSAVARVCPDGLANHFGAATFFGASEGLDGDSDFATDGGGATGASAAATEAVGGRAIHAKTTSEPAPTATDAITSGQNRKPVRRLLDRRCWAGRAQADLRVFRYPFLPDVPQQAYRRKSFEEPRVRFVHRHAVITILLLPQPSC